MDGQSKKLDRELKAAHRSLTLERFFSGKPTYSFLKANGVLYPL